MNVPKALFWFRRDLRLFDNHGLSVALQQVQGVLPVFIFDRYILDELDDCRDRRVTFIHKRLWQLKQKLQALGSDLEVLCGRPEQVVPDLVRRYGVKAVYANEDYEPKALERDRTVASTLKSMGVGLHLFKDQCIFARSEVVKGDGSPYTVFTPYSRRWRERLRPDDLEPFEVERYLSHLAEIEAPSPMPSLESIGFEDAEFSFPRALWQDTHLRDYDRLRDYPALKATSLLGIHLRFGTISIRKLVREAGAINETWQTQLIWRDFFFQILHHFPHVTQRAFRPKYDLIPWRNDGEEFERWCKGETGYPIVDAGMRELNNTGHMHNRVRMIVASFLCKHLLIDWRKGERYFASKLLDFDLAANNGNWQWAAGTGCDAAPYFRVFNPYTQTKKFDSDGVYVNTWVPEWKDTHYPEPMVDHAFARKRALETYKEGIELAEAKALAL